MGGTELVSSISTQTATDKADQTKHRKLVDAAQQFEAVFLNEMLKSSFGQTEEDGGGETTGPEETMRSLGVESVSKAISAAGGLGIARQIVHSVEAEQAQHEGAKKLQTVLKS